MLKMKSCLFAAGLAVICGCNQGTPGGPGVHIETQTQTTNKPVIGDDKSTFSIKVPLLSTSLKQGESKTATIGIARGSQFDDNIKLNFSNIPNGVNIDPVAPVVKNGEKETTINVSADDTAAIGDFKVKVMGSSNSGGPDALADLKITVSSK